MAGTGRVSIPLAIDGAAAHRVVVAVDYCNSMLRKLSEKATNVSPRGIIETMYQDARKLDLGERKFKIRTFTALARHLAPHGTLILTLHNPTVKRESYKNISQSGTEPKDPELAEADSHFRKHRGIFQGGTI
ncbi:hypothetical protein Pelo_8208 [Pelomyxa schiedti]|nr:hypothetical protein Pelo_8208 [Pelomyxa schiedti]